jgi:hypothetical protein
VSQDSRDKDNQIRRQRRMKAFRRRSKAAEAGVHLPTYAELLRGSPFMGEALRQDAQAFAERLLSRIAPDTPEGWIAREKIQALTLLPLSVDFRAASRALQDYAEKNSKAQEDLLECARRCELYAAAAGSSDSAFATARWAMRLGSDRLNPADEAYGFAVSGIGWMIMANDYLPAYALNDNAPEFAVKLGGYLLEKLFEERNRRELEIKSQPKNETPAAPRDASDVAVAFDAVNADDPLSVVVLRALGNSDVGGGKTVAREFEQMIGKRLPLFAVPDLSKLHNALTAEFPHAEIVVDAIIDSLVGQPCIKLKPTILVGTPGCGKTAFASRIFQLLGIPSERYSCGGVSDSSLAGCARRWSTGEPSLPLSLVRRYMCASPGIVLDEVEKVGTSNYNGSLLDALLGLLEPESSANWLDPYIQGAVNLSHVLWIATANSLDGLPPPLRDRCRILPFPDPEPGHLQVLANRLLKRIVVDRGLDERWALPLNGIELDALGRIWPGGSLRKLERLVEAVFKARNLTASMQ